MLAQNIPQSPPLTTSPIERVTPQPQPKATPRLVPLPAPGQLGTEGAAPVTISSVEITGVTKYDPAQFAPTYQGLVGTPVPQDKLGEVVRAIQTRYRNDGYFLTVVRGTVEGPADGQVLRIRVVEGFISDVKIEGDIGPAGVLVYRFLERLTAYRPVNISDVERALLLVQSIPGISVRAVLRPGAGEVGAVELVAQVGRKAFGGVAQYDNRGSKFAGPSEVLVSAYASSFTSLGEQTEVTIFDTPLDEEQLFGQIASEAFIGSSGLKVRAYYGQGISKPGDVLAASEFKSHLIVAGLSTSYPFIRTRPLSVTGTLAFDASRSTIDLAANLNSVTNLRILRAGGTVDFQDDTFGLGLVGASSFTATVHHGLRILGAGSQALDRQGSDPSFVKYTGEFTRVQNLFELGDILFALKLSVAAQFTNDVIPSNEKYFLGGTRFGRGYFSGEITGDRAFAHSIELQANTTIEGIFNAGVQYYGFYDGGHTNDLAVGDVDHHLESAGLGVRVDLTPEFTWEVEGVRRFTHNPAGASAAPDRPNAVFLRLVGRL